jgi:phospholipid/cholesterol/gamma-HCH transport system substrate-binding protein/paraquat-inducible protein B
MSERANYFKIGLFVLCGAVIAVVGLLALGAGSLLQKKFFAESYFEESVQGLDIGSPIKFRGVQIGRVETITLVGAEYSTDKRYVLVRFSLYRDAIGALSQAAVQRFVDSEVEKGLRVRLAFQGVTGAAYLEADYLEAERAPWLSIDWQPNYPFLPSAPSTITRYSEAIDKILKNIEHIDIQAIGAGLEKALTAMNGFMENAQVGEIGQQTIQLLTELRATNQRLEQMVTRAETPIDHILQELPTTVQNLNRLTAQLNALAGDLPENIAPLGSTLRRLNGLLAAEQQTIEETLDNIQQVSENLRDMTDDARRYPAQMLLGAPPPPVEP